MINSRSGSDRIAWLTACWASHRGRVIKLLARLTDLGPIHALSPHLFGKFMVMLDQIAAEKEKELSILDQIESIERQHQYRREHNQLASASAEPFCHLTDVALLEPAPKKATWLTAWLLMLTASSSRAAEKQGFKVS